MNTHIVVNGRWYEIPTDAISYNELAHLAGYPRQLKALSIVYRKARDGGSGILTYPYSIEIAEGMIFDVCDTSRA